MSPDFATSSSNSLSIVGSLYNRPYSMMTQSSISCSVVCGEVPSFSRVELPCFVQSTEKAFECIGGNEVVIEALKDMDITETPMQFRYPAASTSFTSLSASVLQKKGLLLRIRRKKSKTGAPAENNASCEIIGTVDRTFVFNNLADYEFLPTPEATTTTSENSKAILDIVPHSFSRDGINKGMQRLVLNEPFRKSASSRPAHAGTSTTAQPSKPAASAAAASHKHAFAQEDEGAAEDTENKQIQEANSRNPDKGLAYFINIEDPVPEQHPRGEYPYDNERGVVLVRLLKKLFSIIPIMTREQIETYLNLEGRVHLFKSCLPYVAYNLVKGPFRQVWVRYGFDPKKDPSTAIYQTIHFRVASKVVQDITERVGRKVGGTVSRSKMVDLDGLRVCDMPINSVTYLLLNRPQQDPPIFAYSHIIKRQLVVQVFQLMDPMLLEYLGTTKLLPTFSNKTGWFSANTLGALRVMALKALPERIHRFVSLPDSIIWKDSTPHEAPPDLSSAVTTSGAFSSTGAQSSSVSYDTAGISALLKESNLDLNEDAAQLGFDEQSTGLFVVCNRTLNTLRTYLRASSAASDPASAVVDTVNAAGEVSRDEVLTVDGIYLGKVLAWHRRYAAVLQGMPFMGHMEYEKYLDSIKPATQSRNTTAIKAKKPRFATATKPKLVSFQDSAASTAGMASTSSTSLVQQSAGGLYTRVLGGPAVEAFSFFNTDEHDSHSDSDSDSGSDAY